MAFTYFFRDVQTLKMLCTYALPSLKTKQFIKIWDAGCAMGPEPYTLALLLREQVSSMYFRNIKIYATDIDNSNLFQKIIHEGIYSKQQVERIPADIFNKYFTPLQENNMFQISPEIRKTISFQKHDLTSLIPIGNNFSIVICKNVLLHLTPSQRIEVIKMFHNALAEGCFFVTEQTQKLPDEVKSLFEPITSHAQVFRKI